MSDIVVDSSVVAKWILPEPDSDRAQDLIVRTAAQGEAMIVLDLVFPEVTNAIWKRQRQKLITTTEAKAFREALQRLPVHVEPAARLLESALDIAMAHDRAVYDALFVALARDLRLNGVTADEPLFNVIHPHFPEILLLRDWQ